MKPIPAEQDDPQQDPVLLTRHWILFRRGYALLWGLLVGLVYVFLPMPGESVGARLGIATALSALVSLATLSAFRLSRLTARKRLNNLTAFLEDATPQPLHPTGWAPFDELTSKVGALQRQLQRSQQEAAHYRLLAESTSGLEGLFDLQGQLQWLSPSSVSMSGYSVEECLSAHDLIELIVYSKDRPQVRETVHKVLHSGAPSEHEFRIQCKDGRLLWVTCLWHMSRGTNNEPRGLRFSATEIQRRKDAEFKLLETVAALRRAQALKEHYLARSNDERMRLSSLLDTVDLGILFADRDRRIVYVNQTAIDIWKLGQRDKIVGMRDSVLIDMTQSLRHDDTSYRQHLEEVIAERARSEPFEVHLTDGRVIREVSAVVPSVEAGRNIGRVWVYEDVTKAHHSALRLTDLAERDPLTGLYNRRRFLEELDRQILDAMRRREAVGLLSFDLDGFKAINDTFGHQAGDEVLMALARELTQVVRRNELSFRLGGDEFAVLVPDTDVERMSQLANRILSAISQRVFHFDGIAASVTVSIGIAIVPEHAQASHSLVTAADRAMYAAKAQGKNCIEIAPLIPIQNTRDLFDPPENDRPDPA